MRLGLLSALAICSNCCIVALAYTANDLTDAHRPANCLRLSGTSAANSVQSPPIRSECSDARLGSMPRYIAVALITFATVFADTIALGPANSVLRG